MQDPTRLFAELPNELGERILRHLRGSELVRLRLVSREWAHRALGCIQRFEWPQEVWRIPKDILIQMPYLDDITLISVAHLEARIAPRKVMPGVQIMRIEPQDDFDPFDNPPCKLQFPALRKLTVMFYGLIPPNLAEIAPNLEELHLRSPCVPLDVLDGLPRLHTLNLIFRPNVHMDQRAIMFQGTAQLPALESLYLECNLPAWDNYAWCNSVKRVHISPLDDVDTLRLVASFPRVEEILVDGQYANHVLPQDFLICQPIRERLTHLTLTHGREMVHLHAFPHLTHLRLEGSVFQLSGVFDLGPRLPIMHSLPLEELRVEARRLLWAVPLHQLQNLRLLHLRVATLDQPPEFRYLPQQLDELLLEGSRESTRHEAMTYPPESWPQPPRKILGSLRSDLAQLAEELVHGARRSVHVIRIGR